MGWYGETRDALNDAAENIKKYPVNTLGWLRAVDDWNNAVINVGENLYEFKEEVKPPGGVDDDWWLSYPSFDSMQPLAVKGAVLVNGFDVSDPESHRHCFPEFKSIMNKGHAIGREMDEFFSRQKLVLVNWVCNAWTDLEKPPIKVIFGPDGVEVQE